MNFNHEYKILAVHFSLNDADRCKITVAIESSPKRFKAYQRDGISKISLTAGIYLFQEVAGCGEKLNPKDANSLFPDILKNYKYEG